MYRMHKKTKALFLVPKPFQLIVSSNNPSRLFRWFFKHGYRDNSCKQCIFTKCNEIYTKKSHADARCEKSLKHCFWYQKPSNLLQVRITHKASFVVCLSTGTTILVTSSHMQQCTGCEKSQKNCFWYQTPSNLLKKRITPF